jgi:hypothetical protein
MQYHDETEAGAAFGNPEVYMEKFWKIRATWKSRFWPISMVTPSGWASAIAPCSAAIRK